MFLSTPSIWTKREVVPLELVTVQVGPGGTQPEGVGPGVNQRFASPFLTVVVIPGVNGLELYETEPVWFAVMSLMRTISGLQGTLGFQEVGVAGVPSTLTRLAGEADSVEMARIAERTISR